MLFYSSVLALLKKVKTKERFQEWLVLFPNGMVTDVYSPHPHSGCLYFLFPVVSNEILPLCLIVIKLQHIVLEMVTTELAYHYPEYRDISLKCF